MNVIVFTGSTIRGSLETSEGAIQIIVDKNGIICPVIAAEEVRWIPSLEPEDISGL
jgi:hypothetical protein